MAIPFKKFGYKINPITDDIETPQVFLVNKRLKKIGELYPVDQLKVTINEINQTDEVSFIYYKEIEDKPCPYFDQLDDLSIIQVGDYGFFECSISKNDTTSIFKNVVAKSLGIAELSQKLVTLEANTDDDIARKDYDKDYPTIFYREDERLKNASLLHRVLSYAPNYKIGYIAPTLMYEERTFSWNDTDIISVFHDIAAELNCVFDVRVTIGENGNAERMVNVYDMQYCEHCYHSGTAAKPHTFRNIINGVCQNCGSSNYIKDIGDDTNIFISTDNLSDEITIEGDKDSIKNCFKIVGGDDTITETVQGINMAGNRIMMFSDAQKNAMSTELIHKLDSYAKDYANNIADFEKILEIQYDLYDMIQYLQSSKMPILESDVTTTLEAVLRVLEKISTYYHNKFYISTWENYGITAAKTSIRNLFTTFMPQGYSFSIDTDSITETDSYMESTNYYWYGSIKIFRTIDKEEYYTLHVGSSGTRLTYGKNDDTDFSYSDSYNYVGNFSVSFHFADKNQSDYMAYIKQHTAYLLSEVDLTYDNEKARAWDKYSYNRLKSYYDGFERCLDAIADLLSTDPENSILIDIKTKYQGIQRDISNQMSILEDQIFSLYSYLGDFSNIGAMDFTDANGNITYTLQNYSDISTVLSHMVTTYPDMMSNMEGSYNQYGTKGILSARNELQNRFNIKNYLNNDDLYSELCSFIREDVYQNENYTSDGLSNAQIIEKAKELKAKAEQELSKACMAQYTVTSSISAIVAQKAFEYNGVMVNDDYSKFMVNNYVRVRIDDEIYKMRIASIGLDFPITDRVNVTFTNISRYHNGAMNDIASILENASNMASSYGYIATQAEKGESASLQFDTIKQEGLNAGLMAVKGGRNQDVLIDNHGILLRKKIEEIDDYSRYQMKLINRNIVMTDDNWLTAKMAIGLGTYKGEPLYGVWCDLLVGDLTITKKLHVINDKATVIIDENGITLDGGAIKWVNKGVTDNIKVYYATSASSTTPPSSGWVEKFTGSLNNMYLWSKTVTTDTVGKETITYNCLGNSPDGIKSTKTQYYLSTSNTYVSGGAWLDYQPTWSGSGYVWTRTCLEYISGKIINTNPVYDEGFTKSLRDFTTFKSNVDTALGTFIPTTDIGSNYIISPKIGGGYLYISSSNYSVEIDPNHGSGNTLSGYLFCIRNKYNNSRIMSVDTSGKGYFKGSIYATDGEFTGKITAVSGEIGGWEITKTGLYTKTTASIIQYGDDGMEIINGKASFGRYHPSTGFLWDYGYVDISRSGIYAKRTATDGYMFKVDTQGAGNIQLGVNGNYPVPIYMYGDTHINGDTKFYDGLILPNNSAGYGIKTSDGNNIIRGNNTADVYIGGGNANAIWLGATNIYYTNKAPSQSGSDRRIKHDIKPADESFVDFIMSLSPCSYKFNDGTSNRTHWGFIADEVEKSLKETTGDSGVFVKIPVDEDTKVDLEDDSTYIGGLRYAEFIAPMIKTIQYLSNEIESLKEEIAQLKIKDGDYNKTNQS